jgi:hypothetical protein
MSRTVEFLSRFCAEHRLEKKYLIVPSYGIGHPIGEAMAKEGGAWVNLHFATLPSLARETAGPQLSARGIKLISQTNALFLVDRVFQRLRASDKLRYFGRVEATAGIVRALLHSIFALRMAGWTSRELKPAPFISRSKGEEIALILGEYEKDLDKEGFVDLPGLYLFALQEARKPTPKSRSAEEKRFYLGLLDRPLEYLEAEFLKTLAGEDLIAVPAEPVFGLRPPAGFAAPLSSAPTPQTNAERLPWLFSPQEAPPALGDDTIRLFSAVGPSNECREILRRIVTEKTRLDEVEIIPPPGPAYPALFYALSAKAGLGVTFAEGIPLAFTLPGKVFSGLIEWLEHDYRASDLCSLIEAGGLKLPSGAGSASLTPLQAGRYLRSALIGWGRERYLLRLQALIDDKKTSAEAAGREEGSGENGDTEDAAAQQDKAAEQIKEVESLLSLIREFLELLPAEDDGGKVDFGAVCRGIAEFIGRFARVTGDLDAEAQSLLRSKLEEAASFETEPLRRPAAFERIKDLGAGLSVGASGPSPGRLHLSTWLSGGHSGRPVTFLAGLDQGAFPGGGIQDPVLLDEERERLNEERKAPGLRTTADSLRETLWRMASLLAGLRGRVTLSYSAYDIIEERPSFPSSVILQAARLVTGKPGLDYSALTEILPEARAFLPGEEMRAVDETDWWLARLAPGGKLRDGMDAVKSNFDALSRGIFARERREKPFVTEFEGKIKVDPDEVHPLRNPAIVVSASRLEKLAKCPFGYMMRYLLEVEPPDELEFDQSQWLNPMLRGILLHEIFAAFMRELRKERKRGKGEAAGAKARDGRGPAVRAREHGPLMTRITAEMIARHKEEIPPPTEAVFEQEKKEIEEAAAVFLKAEEAREGAGEPLLFEVSFGTPRSGEGEENEDRMPEPAVLDLGGGRRLSISGRIDRIDRLEDGRYRVIDYKTGSYSAFEDLDMFGKGKILQHGLYAVAAEQILRQLKIDPRPVVAESGYYFPTRRGEGNTIFREMDRRRFNELVMDLLGIIEKGHFVANPGLGEADCGYCDYSNICRSAAVRERAKGKKEKNPDVFGIFDKLKEYE